MLEIEGLLFVNSQNTHVDGWSETCTFPFPLNVFAWSAERSIAISCEPRCTLISCVGAIMLRTTTLLKPGFFGPQYFGFGTSVSCDVVLYDFSSYGPLPAPADADELNHCSAVSAVDASAAAVPPCALTSFELTMPVDGFARIAVSCVAGVVDFMMTVYLPLAEMVIPASRDEGFPLMLINRFSEK